MTATMFRSQRLWLPGAFQSNNKMLELKRTEGFEAGCQHYMRGSRKWLAAHKFRRVFSREVARIRAYTAAQAKKQGLVPVPGSRRVTLGFILVGHARYDASAWYLAAKAIEDGLQDAGVIGRDGADVYDIWGRCERDADVAAKLLGATGVPSPAQGMIVQVSLWD